MRASFRSILSVLALSFVALCARAMAQQASPDQQLDLTKGPYREIWEKSQRLRPKPSMDATPVPIGMAGTRYLIPRNYLVDLGPDVPMLRVTWPGFQPLREDNQHCFTPLTRAGHDPACTFLELRLQGKGITLSEQHANSMRDIPTSRTIQQDGYEIYHIGPSDQGIDYYWRDGEFPSLFNCIGVVCNDTVPIQDGNNVLFFFRPALISQVPAIEQHIRQLFARFNEGSRK
jgi:hypothetical protein